MQKNYYLAFMQVILQFGMFVLKTECLSVKNKLHSNWYGDPPFVYWTITKNEKSWLFMKIFKYIF